MAHAVKRSLGGESRSTRDKRIPDIHERADQALVAAPLTKKTIAKEEDVSWQQLLDLNSTLPKVRGRGEDGGLRLRNLFLFFIHSFSEDEEPFSLYFIYSFSEDEEPGKAEDRHGPELQAAKR